MIYKRPFILNRLLLMLLLKTIQIEQYTLTILELDWVIDITGSMDDLQKAFRVGQAAVDATPEDHPDLANRLSNLGISLSD